VLIGMALGIALGRVDPQLAAKMGPLDDAFIKLIRMLIAPRWTAPRQPILEFVLPEGQMRVWFALGLQLNDRPI
jgi:hypothetical protein